MGNVGKHNSLLKFIFWIVCFYPILLGVHLLLDHFLGTQSFYEALTRGSRRLLLKQIVEGWVYTLWMPILFTILSFLNSNKAWSSMGLILFKLVLCIAILLLIKMAFCFSYMQILPITCAFLFVFTAQHLIFGVNR